MIVVVATTIGILSVKLVGGRLRRLAQLDIRHLWLIWLTIAVQTIIFELPPTIVSDRMYGIVHIATYASAFGFLWLNRRVPGAVIIGIGAACNAAAIIANDGIMPATAEAWALAGLPTAPAGEFENSGVTPKADLWYLGDIWAIPERWPLSNVFSIGDVIIVFGGTWLAHRWCRTARPSNAWPAPDPASAVDVADSPADSSVHATAA